MAAKDDLGRAGEERAVRYLSAIGYRVLDRNWRCDQGEVDIVARVDTRLVIVEVKTRRTDSFGHPFEAVDHRKRRRLWQLAHAWVAAHPGESLGLDIAVEAIGIVGTDPATGELEHLLDLS